MSQSMIAQILQVCRPQLVSGQFYSGALVDYLHSENCINTEELERVNCHGRTTFERSRNLIDILRTKPNSVLDVILAALREDGTQPHLETALKEAIFNYESQMQARGAAAGAVPVTNDALLRLRNLVIEDPVALDRWSRVVDHIVPFEVDKRVVKAKLQSTSSENIVEGVLMSLQMWNSSQTSSLTQVLQNVGLNALVASARVVVPNCIRL